MHERLPDELTPEEGRELVRQVAAFGNPAPVLVLTGGDCLERPDIFEIAALAVELGVKPAVSPSVTPRLQPAVFRRIHRVGVDAVSISLDGATGTTHDGVRGVPGHFTATIESICSAVASGLRVQVNTAVMRENMDELPLLASLLRGLQVSVWELFFLVVTGRAAAGSALTAGECEEVCHLLFDASGYGFAVRTVEAPFFRRVSSWRQSAAQDPDVVADTFGLGPYYGDPRGSCEPCSAHQPGRPPCTARQLATDPGSSSSPTTATSIRLGSSRSLWATSVTCHSPSCIKPIRCCWRSAAPPSAVAAGSASTGSCAAALARAPSRAIATRWVRTPRAAIDRRPPNGSSVGERMIVERQQQPRELPLLQSEVEGDIAAFENLARAFAAGEVSDDVFRPFRLSLGIYGQRQAGYQMIRVKIPHGRLTADQLDVLATFSEQFCDEGEYPCGGGRGMGHVTTRQDIQFHFVPLARVGDALRHLAQAGLTTRDACYNTVRNITGCPLAGACGSEAFDITPYAQAATELFLRNPICQNLPRKFKISFSGCETDCALGAMHDIGAVARVRNGERGFRLWVGGGLGNSPRPATLLDEFVPVHSFYAVIEAVIRIFDAEGPRKNRNRARIKFMFDRTYTADTFRARVDEVAAALPEDARCYQILDSLLQRVSGEEAHRDAVTLHPTVSLDGVARGIRFARWRDTNVTPHRLPRHGLVHIRLPLGDITAPQLRVAARASRRFSGGEVRASVGQNLVLRDVHLDDLGALYDVLLPHGLAEAAALGIRDVVTCPGADTCNLGITAGRSRPHRCAHHRGKH